MAECISVWRPRPAKYASLLGLHSEIDAESRRIGTGQLLPTAIFHRFTAQ
jgi:hypothetical protein